MVSLSGTSPELKTFYSKKLLSRLVPALQHGAGIGVEGNVGGVGFEVGMDDTDDNREFLTAVSKWQRYFGMV